PPAQRARSTPAEGSAAGPPAVVRTQASLAVLFPDPFGDDLTAGASGPDLRAVGVVLEPHLDLRSAVFTFRLHAEAGARDGRHERDGVARARERRGAAHERERASRHRGS